MKNRNLLITAGIATAMVLALAGYTGYQTGRTYAKSSREKAIHLAHTQQSIKIEHEYNIKHQTLTNAFVHTMDSLANLKDTPSARFQLEIRRYQKDILKLKRDRTESLLTINQVTQDLLETCR